MPKQPKHTLGDGPLDSQYLESMQGIAQALDQIFNGEQRGQARETGFVLLVFPFGDAVGRCNYISNGADHRDIVALLKEQVARFEGMAEQTGSA